MQAGVVLEVTIGLVMTWLILSVTTSQIQEWITDKLDWRSRFLEGQLRNMMKDERMMQTFYKHPLIQPLHIEKIVPFWWIRVPLAKMAKKSKLFAWLEMLTGNVTERIKIVKPIEISNQAFASAAVDIFLNAGKTDIPAGTMSLEQMRTAFHGSITQMANSNLGEVVKYMAPAFDHMSNTAEDAEKALAKFRTNVETWFDTTMQKATVMYRENFKKYAFLIGFVLAVTFNVDSINITNVLWRNPTLRAAIVAQAPALSTEPEDTVKNTMKQLDALELPVGWVIVPCELLPSTEGLIIFQRTATDAGGVKKVVSCRALVNTPEGWLDYIYKLLGFLISAVAASQGAPFWFDALNKLLGLKKTKLAEDAKG
jgi:hypothetical protein